MPEHCKVLLRRPLSAPATQLPGQVPKNIASHHKAYGQYEGRKQCFAKSSKQSCQNDTTVIGQLYQTKQAKPYLEHKWNKLQLKNCFPQDCQSNLTQVNKNLSTGSKFNQTLSDVSTTNNGSTLQKVVVKSQGLVDSTSKLSICYPYNISTNGVAACHASTTCNSDSKVLVCQNTLEFQITTDINENADLIGKNTFLHGQPEPSCGYLHMQSAKDMSHFAMQYRKNNFTYPPLEEPCKTESSFLPACLGHLSPWLVSDDRASTSDIADTAGIGPQNALIFLTDSHLHNLNTLPVLPSQHDVNKDLPHYGVIIEEMITYKKYRHSWMARKDDSCGHCDHVHGDSFKKSRYKLEFRKKGGKARTPELVRREMYDLECLLKGIASEDSDCIIVKYQNDIHHLQSLVTSVLSSITVPSASEHCDGWTIEEVPKHTSGLKQSINEHEEVISAIKQQHESCVLELHELEQNLPGHQAKYF